MHQQLTLTSSGPKLDWGVVLSPSSHCRGFPDCWRILFALGELSPRLRCCWGPFVPFWLLCWGLDPVFLAFARPYVKHRHRLFELHKHWWVHMKWRKCKAFKLGFSSWNPSGWRSFCQTDAPGHNFSQSPHYQLFIKAQLLIFFSGQLCNFLVKSRNNNAPNYINVDYF